MTRPCIVLSGGAGYLGRSIGEWLALQGYAPVALDNFSTSRRFRSPRLPCIEVDLTKVDATRRVWKKLPRVAGIFHFAARALVSESHERPGEYFRNNLMSTLTLAEIAAEQGIPFLHSSSCAVYGIPSVVPIDESAALAPISPYGETKRVSEAILQQFAQSKGVRVLNLRYFNPAGAIAGLNHGEAHEPETHLIPAILRAALAKKPVTVFGTDYPTPDGSCIRDFIHVEDLARGHLLAFQYLEKQKPGFSDAVNLGSGRGNSVLEVIAAANTVLGTSLRIRYQDRRPGDPPRLVAATRKASTVLGWKPALNLEAMLRSHLEWEKARKYGMKKASRSTKTRRKK